MNIRNKFKKTIAAVATEPTAIQVTISISRSLLTSHDNPIYQRFFIKGAEPLSIPLPKNLLPGCPRGALAPLYSIFPLSFEGEGDKGGEVENSIN